MANHCSFIPLYPLPSSHVLSPFGRSQTSSHQTPSFIFHVPRSIAHILNRSYSTGRCHLSGIGMHSGIGHVIRKLAKDPVQPTGNFVMAQQRQYRA
ncbi:hypothetical protein BGW80DRAFT_1320806 [Lactifluus volemus]|nr:hypothetical protein BGW80DRAFT_1320806 [Lactifluus volemus]